MKLLVIIVSYKVTDLTIDCLESLSSQIRDIEGIQVAVCENGTGQDAAQRLQEIIDRRGWSSWATLTAISPNRGFTGGNNAIIAPAMRLPDPPEYFLLLNADTVARPGALRSLVEFMDEHPKAGIAGSRLESLEGVPRSTAFRFFSITGEADLALRLGFVSRLLQRSAVTMPLPVQPCQVDWVSGASLIVRREVLGDIGLLDEELYTYFDDIDFCMRAKRAHWQVWFVPDSHVVHLQGQTTGITAMVKRPNRRPDYWFEARRLFWLKNYGPVKTAAADAVWIVGFALWRIRRLLTRKEDNDPPRLLWDFIRHSVWLKGFRRRPVRNPALSDGR